MRVFFMYVKMDKSQNMSLRAGGPHLSLRGLRKRPKQSRFNPPFNKGGCRGIKGEIGRFRITTLAMTKEEFSSEVTK